MDVRHGSSVAEPELTASIAARDIQEVLELAGDVRNEAPLPLAPDFAGVVADVRKVLTVAELAKLVGVKERQVHHWAAGTHNPQGEIRDRLLMLHQIVGQLRTSLSAEQIKVWIWSPHPELPLSPAECLARGHVDSVLRVAREISQREELDDEYLVALAKEGNSSAYDSLVRRFRGFVRLKAASYFLLGGEADDLIQEGLLGLYKAIRDYRVGEERSFREFAELCITRQIITAVRVAAQNRNQSVHDGVRGREDQSRSDHTAVDPPNQIIASQAIESLVASLTGLSGVLSDLESRALSLYLDGYSYEATAERLECDVAKVDEALRGAKRKIGQYLEGLDQAI